MGKSLNDIKLRVTYYSRVSTDHFEQKKSLLNQVDYFREYILSNSNWSYVEGYVDDGITGTSDVKRNDFMKMIEDAKDNKFDLIITKEISRFSRNTLDSIKYTRLLLSYGVAVFFVNDNINTLLSDSELRLTIMASMAQDEVRRLSERVKFGMNRSIEKGEILGNDMLYGYKKDKNSGCLNVVEEESVIVKRIYRLYAVDLLSLSSISKLFNCEGLKTRDGKRWSISTISRMIDNPKYKGYYCGRKTEIVDYMTKKVKYITKDNWKVYKDSKRIPPIVSEALWERANKRLSARKRPFSFKKSHKEIFDKYLYSAKIFCFDHDLVFHRRKFRKKVDDFTWVCAGYLEKGKSFCNSPNIRESELSCIFNDLISYLNVPLSFVISFLMECYKKKEFIDDKLYQLLRKKDAIYMKKNKILKLNIEGLISDIDFSNYNSSFNKELSLIDEEIEFLFKKESNDLDINAILLDKVYSNTVFEKLISLLIKKIVVSKVLNDKNDLILDVYFSSYLDNFNNFICKYYSFQRGYDTKSTKRYKICYKVNCFFD